MEWAARRRARWLPAPRSRRCSPDFGGLPAASNSGRYCRVWFRRPTRRATKPGGVAMATTLVACALRFDRVVVSHVGDSRCYSIRHGRATALTRDHTLVGERARLGLISAKGAAEAQNRHVLTRSLGNAMFVGVETSDHLLLPGDVLLLCSDGLHGAVPAGEMAAIVTRNTNLDSAARELIAAANEQGGADNVSVQLIRIRSVERVGMYRGRPYKLA